MVKGTTEEAAKDIAAFVAIFFQNFSKFRGRAFHMAGESYAVSVEQLLAFQWNCTQCGVGTLRTSFRRRGL